MTGTNMPAALAAASNAIAHARAKHGDRCIEHLDQWQRLAVITEEVGEVARAVLKLPPFCDDEQRANLCAELAQVAACALMWLAQEMGE